MQFELVEQQQQHHNQKYVANQEMAYAIWLTVWILDSEFIGFAVVGCYMV